MSYRFGNFSRGYALMEFILEDHKNTLKEAAKEFRIAETTARADIYRAGQDAMDGLCREPDKVKGMFIKTMRQLRNNSGKKA